MHLCVARAGLYVLEQSNLATRSTCYHERSILTLTVDNSTLVDAGQITMVVTNVCAKTVSPLTS